MSKTYIDREAALNKLRQMRDDYRSRYNGAEAAAIAEYCRDALIDIPTADVVEVRHGRWIEDGYYNEPCVCSFCGEPCKDTVMGRPMCNYCSNCGAKMDGGVNDGYLSAERI